MLTQVIFVFCVIVSTYGSEPQVYEIGEDQESNPRVVRDPFKQQKAKMYKPPIFDYQLAMQQDQRKNRYAQQQRADMENLLKKNKPASKQETPLRLSLVQNWKVIDPTASPSNVEEDYKLPEDQNNTNAVSPTRKPVTSRKLNPISYYEDVGEKKSNVKRQDQNSQLVYVNPEMIKQHFHISPGAQPDINALNALVGQHPNIQLEGLKKLLENPQSNYVLPPIKGPLPFKDHTPIAEQILDIPNPETKPNIKVDHGFSGQSPSLDTLQAQLDAAAKAQFQKALAQAQQEAMVHVEAQHQAIAKAQENARVKVLEQIRLHNEGLKPLALPLQSEVEPINVYAPSHDHKSQQPLTLPLQATVQPVYAHTHEHKSLALPIQATVQPTYVPSYERQPQRVEATNNKKKTKLEKVSITKTHSVTQGTRSPNAYQEVVLETRQQTQKILPELDHHDLHANLDDQKQYAARYAFGYKVRDMKMGNEFGHQEKRDGKNAEGNYHVLLPDGRMQKVEYFVDPSGYHAKVTYQNLAHH